MFYFVLLKSFLSFLNESNVFLEIRQIQLKKSLFNLNLNSLYKNC